MAQKPELYDNFYMFHEATSSANIPPKSCIPWCAALLLATKSKNHVFSKENSLNVKGVLKSIDHLSSKILWSYKHRNNTDPPNVRLLPSDPPPFTDPFVERGIAMFVTALSRNLKEKVREV